jgi:hypothetical protein
VEEWTMRVSDGIFGFQRDGQQRSKAASQSGMRTAAVAAAPPPASSRSSTRSSPAASTGRVAVCAPRPHECWKSRQLKAAP